ncbi:cytochrome P450 [Colletotrichum limetticola]|uniref:Cytochrome P450 n=1 Tax=Colletotrichum limetticola TaxID=1209924 RepID=A0ABQ9PYL4_9PEZI|nr:cytochrome P450 [Colletotrichum limetticola]
MSFFSCITEIEGVSRWAVLISGLVAAYLSCLAVYRAFFHPLNKYPGPILNRLTNLPFVIAGVKGQLPFYAESLFKKYGPVVRMGPNNLGFIEGNAWKDIYGMRRRGQFEKAYEYYREGPEGPISLLNAGPEEHARLRKWVSPYFSDRGMKEQEPMIGGYVDLLLKRLHENCDDGTRALDLRDWFNFCTFDILGELAFSSSFGCLESAEYHPWVKIIAFQQKEIEWIGELNRQGLRFITAIIMKVLAKNKLEFMGYTIQKLQSRIQSGKQADIIESLLNNKEGMIPEQSGTNQREQKLDMDRLVQNSTLLIAAGSETTATLLTATSFLLLSNPEAYQKVVEEVRSSFSDPSDITLLSVNKLPYMLACLDEALRVFPVVPSWLPRRVTHGTAIIDGNIVPEGCLVATWQWAMYHNELNFTKPLEYHPERFLGDPSFSKDRLDAFQPFSMGHADCVGRNLAYSEMRLILARILFSFDLKLADEGSDWIKGQKVYIVWQKPSLNVYLKPVKR